MRKKAGKFLCSMKCAMLLLIILVIACTLGSLIPQGQVLSYYTGKYSARTAQILLLLGLDDVFHCWWFQVLTVFLCLNLLFCNVLRFPGLIRRTKCGFTLEGCLAAQKQPVGTVRDAEAVFQKMGFRRVQAFHKEEGEYLYGFRNRAGLWGAWLCHLGMLVIIGAFALGQIRTEEYTIYGTAGETKEVPELSLEVSIDDFRILLREDDTVEQYEADLTVTDTRSQVSKSGSARVNAPASLFGLKFYQNSTGWAARVSVWKGTEKLQEELLCAGEYLRTEGKEDLALMFRSFYPDYALDEAGNAMTRSSALKNPAYLYTLYYKDQVLGMNVIQDGEAITVDEYTFRFHDPCPYTLIQIKRDAFAGLAAAGGLMVILALVLAFYVRPEEVWAMQREDGNWEIYGRSRKAGVIFEETLREKCEEGRKKNG